MDDIRKEAILRFSQVRGVVPEALDLEFELDDADDEVVEELCQAARLRPEDVFPRWPGTRRNEFAVAGVRRLAPIWPPAAERLSELRLRWEMPTLGSFIRSIEERRPVGSGRWEEIQEPPIPPHRVAVRFLAWSFLPVGPMILLAWSGCNPACRTCPPLVETAQSPLLLLPLGATAGVHVAMLLAAWTELRRPRPVTAAAMR